MADVDANFLPLVYEILKSADKDSHEVAGKVTELRNKLDSAREQVKQLPGVDSSKEEQERQTEVLRKQLISKTDLLRRYKTMCIFDVPDQ